ncbi:MAG: hypothetical protein DRJ60_00325 [Thermoprotei archaeon]|nr:MAG: hypothetical protein DRJ60_00325 [Thermoprotei archaeon]
MEFEVQGEYLPIRLSGNFPVVNRKATFSSLQIYVGLKEKEFRGKKYLVAKKASEKDVAPEGAVVHFVYRTGSHSNVYHSYVFFGVVAKTGMQRLTLKDNVGEKDVEIEIENILPIPCIDENEKKALKAEIMNKGLLPSHYEPVELLYKLWMKEKAIPTQQEATNIEEEVITPEKVEKAFSQGSEELELEEVQIPQAQPEAKKQELVPLYLLAFEMPSAYLAVHSYTANAEVEERKFEVEVRSVLEGFRNRFYREISKIFHNTYYGWIAVTEKAIEEAERWNGEAIEVIKTALRNAKTLAVENRLKLALQRRFVKAVKIYMDVNDAKELLEEAIKKMSEEIEELQARINNAEKASMKKKIQKMLEDLIAKKAMFEKYLSQL